MKIILKHHKFNLFWHREDGWIHYDDAERFNGEDAESTCIPREYVNGKMVDAGAWIPDDAFIQLDVRVEDFTDALKEAAAEFASATRRYIDACVMLFDLFKDNDNVDGD